MTQIRIEGLLRPGEIARLFGIDESTVRLADKQGRFEADQRTPGGHRRYDPYKAIAFYDELRRWAGKPRASTAEAFNDPRVKQALAVAVEPIGKGRLERLRASCTVAECGWAITLPRSLGATAEARHFAARLYVGHLLDDHADRI